MSSSIAVKRSVSMDFLKQTAAHLAGGSIEYVKDIMPGTTSNISEVKNTMSEIHTAFKDTSASALSSLKQLKSSIGIKSITNWFYEKESEFDIESGGSEILGDFDDGTTQSELVESQISEADRNASKISKTVVETSHQMVEAQLAATASINNTLTNQAAVISDGFKQTNSLLKDLLEVVTKNTSALVELTTAKANMDSILKEESSVSSAKRRMIGNGKFNLADYKTILKSNFEESEIGVGFSMLKMLLSPESIKERLGPKNLVKTALEKGVNKLAPNFEKNARALDEAINNTIMTSLIRISQTKPGANLGINLGEIFGLNAKREKLDTSRSELKLKTVPFDSVARESLVGAIPWYLRKILEAVGGGDYIYDMRSRSVKTQKKIEKEFRQAVVGRSQFHRASDRIKDGLGRDEFTKMAYNLMINDLSSGTHSNGNAADIINSFKNSKSGEKYLKKLLGNDVNSVDKENIKILASRLSTLLSGDERGYSASDIFNQAARYAINRSVQGNKYIEDADAYGLDLSFIKDGKKKDAATIKKMYGRGDLNGSEISEKKTLSPSHITGTDYTNVALYEIYRKLNKGINVFQVGSSDKQKRPFKNDNLKYLRPPVGYKPKTISKSEISGESSGGSTMTRIRDKDDENLLRNNTDADGNTESLSRSQRFGRWAKSRGGEFIDAMFTGNPADVKRAFMNIVEDVGGIAKDKSKQGLSKLNSRYGNAAGYLKHKLTGSGYEYKDENGNTVQVSENKGKEGKGGGYLGFLKDKLFGKLDSANSYAHSWINDVKGYFDYGDSNGKKDKKADATNKKRRKLIGAAVGAFSGSKFGLLGGPLGMLVGAIAGSALASTGIGDKIKERLFGRDDDGKAKGLFTKAFDKISRPIQFQLEKNFHFFGNALKKNVFGPISDLGFAIKERMIHHVDSMWTKGKKFIFGKLKQFGDWFGGTKVGKGLKKVGSTIKKAPGFLAEKLYDGVVGVTGAYQRAKVGATTGAFGLLTGGLANGIIKHTGSYEEDPVTGEKVWISGKDKLAERRAARKREVDLDYDKYKGFGAYKRFNQAKDAQKAQEKRELESYLGEDRNIVENPEAGQNQGIHDRLDTIIEVMTGKKVVTDGENVKLSNDKSTIHGLPDNDSGDGFADSAIGATATMMMSGEDISTDEANLANEIIDNAKDGKPNRSTISNKLKKMMGLQKTKKEGEEEKKETLWDKLAKFGSTLGSILGNLGTIALAAAGLWALGKDLMNEDGILHRILKGIQNIGKDSNDPDVDDPTTGANAITSLADIKADSLLDYATPLAELYHNDSDPAGNNVVNSAATKAKDQLLWRGNLTSFIRGDKSFISRMSGARSSVANGFALVQEGAARKIENSFLGKTKWGKKQSGKLRNRADRNLDIAYNQDDIASNKSTTGQHAMSAFGDMLTIGGVSTATGGIAKLTAKALGKSDETAQKAGSVVSAGTSSIMTANMISSSITGKKSWASWIKDVVVKAIDWLVGKFGKEKAFSKGLSKITKWGDDAISAITKGFTEKFINKIATKLVALTGKGTVEQAASALTVGIPIAIGAVSGMIAGYCSVEYMFGVLPGEADGFMKTISVLMEGALGALEWVPIAGYFVAILDIIDEILLAIPSIGKSFTQWTAGFLYNINDWIVNGRKEGFEFGANLESKRNDFEAEREWVNNTYGTNMTHNTFNDEMNNNGWLSRLINGKAYKEEGAEHYKRDEAGKLLRKSGLKNLVIGNESEYVKDANGNVLRNSYGDAITKTDKYGTVDYKKNMKTLDYASVGMNVLLRQLTGGDVYATDENGNILYDESGNAVVDHKEGNVIQRIFDKDQSFLGEQLTNMANANKKNKKSGSIISALGFKAGLKGLSEGVKSLKEDQYETDEYGNVLTDENGNPIKKGKIGSFISAAFNGFKSSIVGDTKKMFEPFSKIAKDKFEVDENGNPLLDSDGNKIEKGEIGTVLKKNHNKFMSSLLAPFEGIFDNDGNIKSDLTSNDTTTKLTKFNNLFKSIITGAVGMGGPEYDDFRSYNWNIKSASDGSQNVGVVGLDAQYEGLDDYQTGTPYKQDNTKEGGNPLNKDYNIISGFGPRSYPTVGTHKGIDIVPKGNDKNADVTARFNGTIEEIISNVPSSDTAEIGPTGKYEYEGDNEEGNMVAIRTSDGRLIKNMHLKYGSIPKGLKVGDTVVIGDKIGEMGSTGWSTGPHLHYQIQDENGNYIDPTSSVQGTNETPTGESVISDSDSSSYVSDSSGTMTIDESGTSSIGGFLSQLKNLGAGFLSKLTGGLIGSDSLSSSGSADGTEYIGMSSAGMASENVMLTGTPNSEWVSIVRSVKQLVAEQRPEYNQSGYIKINYNGKTLTTRTDCTGIICAMLKLYGAMPENGNVNSSGLLRDGAITKGFTKANWSGWDSLVEGDIIARNGHAEIFAYNDGSHHYVYNGGSTKALASPGATYTSHKEGYSVIWRCNEAAGSTINGAANGTLGSGTVLQFPAEFGTTETYEKEILKGKYDSPTHGWAASSRQGALRKDAIANNRLKSQNIFGLDNVATIDNRMLIATKENIGNQLPVNIGDHLDVQFEDGSVWNTMVGDIKGSDAPHPWGHDNGKSSVEIIYWDYEHNSGNQKKKVKQIVKIGESYQNGEASKQDVSYNDDFRSKVLGVSSNVPENNVGVMDKDAQYEGLGGPTEDNGQQSSFRPKILHPQTSTPKTNNTDTTESVTTTQYTSPGMTSRTDTSQVIALLYQVIDNLESINGNTNRSSSYLKQMGENGIVDKGLRDEFAQASKVISSKQAQMAKSNFRSSTSVSNNRMVSGLARPV